MTTHGIRFDAPEISWLINSLDQFLINTKPDVGLKRRHWYASPVGLDSWASRDDSVVADVEINEFNWPDRERLR